MGFGIRDPGSNKLMKLSENTTLYVFPNRCPRMKRVGSGRLSLLTFVNKAANPVYTVVYNVYKNSINPLFVQVDIVDMVFTNVNVTTTNVGGDVS